MAMEGARGIGTIGGALWGHCGGHVGLRQRGRGWLGEEAEGARQWGMENGLGQSLGMGLRWKWGKAGECGTRPVAN